MQFPILSVIVLTPIIAGMLILLIPSDRKSETRVLALAAATICLLLSGWVYFNYNVSIGGYQFLEKYNWLPQFGISYFVGVDGMNAPLVLLTGVVMFTGVLISWGIDDRPREFFAFPRLIQKRAAGGCYHPWVFLFSFLVESFLVACSRDYPRVAVIRRVAMRVERGSARCSGGRAVCAGQVPSGRMLKWWRREPGIFRFDPSVPTISQSEGLCRQVSRIPATPR